MTVPVSLPSPQGGFETGAAPPQEPGDLPYRNVLHELLATLVGCPGDVFVDHTPQDNRHGGFPMASPAACQLKLAEDLTWIEGPDRAVLNDVVRLGFHYRELHGWVRSERHPGKVMTGSLVGTSAYRRAVAAGLGEVLEVYEAGVLRLEQQILEDGCPALSFLQAFAAEFHGILVPLHAMVFRMLKENARGRGVLADLQRCAACGAPALAACVERLLWHANQVLFRQLSAWMVHGLLQDPHGEFFIRRAEDDDEADENDPAGRDRDNAGGPDAAAQHAEDPDLEADPDHALMMEWHHGFQVSMGSLPAGITVPVAADILFIGKAVRVLRKPGGSFSRQELLPAEDLLAATEALAKLQDRPSFSQLEFEQMVEQVRSRVAGRLWKLVVIDAELPLRLRALKDYFLMARGDFFQSFLQDARELLSAPPRKGKTAEADISIPFQQAALKSTAADDKLFSNLTIRVNTSLAPDEASASQDSCPVATPFGGVVAVPKYYFNQWESMSLDFKVAWPLGLLLTPEVLSTYNILFRYLVRLKQVEMDLHEVWTWMKAAPWKLDPERILLWQLRQHMSYVFTNIQTYYQMDVIEAQYTKLGNSLSKAQDFKEAQRAHDSFLTALMDTSLLDMPMFVSYLTHLMKTTKELHMHVYREAMLHEPSPTSEPKQVKELSRRFSKYLGQLYKSLDATSKRNQSQRPAVRQLLIRLNFNGFIDPHRI